MNMTQRQRAKNHHAKMRYLKKLRNDGLTFSEIGAIFGVGASYASAMLRKYEWDTRNLSQPVADKTTKIPQGYDVFKEFKSHYDEVIFNQ